MYYLMFSWYNFVLFSMYALNDMWRFWYHNFCFIRLRYAWNCTDDMISGGNEIVSRSLMTISRTKDIKWNSFDMFTCGSEMISCNFEIFNNPKKVKSRINEMRTYKWESSITWSYTSYVRYTSSMSFRNR